MADMIEAWGFMLTLYLTPESTLPIRIIDGAQSSFVGGITKADCTQALRQAVTTFEGYRLRVVQNGECKQMELRQ